MKKNYLSFVFLLICISTNAQYNKLLDFDSTNGSYPAGSLISDGTSLYGMTGGGGTNDMGIIFKIKPDGTGFVKLLDFNGSTNGGSPASSLIFDGTFFYGMTTGGGTNGWGVIFKMGPGGTGFVKLLDFAGSSNGNDPEGTLISDGTFLYGMTRLGGINDKGVVFKIKSDGTGYSKLLDFDGSSNGRNPSGSLISDGIFLYGMTGGGGTNDMGVIFKIKPDGTGFVKLLDFAGSSNGSAPHGSLIYDGAFLYGMTEFGGNGDGVIFKIKPDGTGFVKLLDFNSSANGAFPAGSLIYDGTLLYGMTVLGGTNSDGVIFKIKPDGTGFVKLLDFAVGSNGSQPYGSLISDSTFLYGMTTQGGTNNMGTVFKIGLATSIEEKEAENIIEISPNPNNGKFQLTIDLGVSGAKEKIEINIYNAFGQKMYSFLPSFNPSIIDLSNYSNGIYFLLANINGQIQTFKLIKM